MAIFNPMLMGRVYFRQLGSAVCVALAGCAGGLPPPVAAPAMPTVVPPQRTAVSSVAESTVLASALRDASAGNFSAAARELSMLEDTTARTRVATHVAATLAERDPANAAQFALAVPEGAAQTAAIETTAQRWVRRDPEAALRWAANVSDASLAWRVRAAVTRVLVQSDPRGAMARILTLPAGPARDDTLASAAAAWARRDAMGAAAWLREWPDDALKPRLTSTIGFEIAHTRPEQAIAVAETLPAGRDRWLLLSAIGQTWVAIDAKAALTWANHLPAGEPRDAALAGIDTGLGLPISRRLAEAPDMSGGGGGRIGTLPADMGPEINSPAFAAWLATQRPGMSREEAILEYVRQRGALEPANVGLWLSMLPGGAARDRATEIYIENVVPTAPAEAANFLRNLPRSERSDEMIERTARQWLQINPAAAEAWLNELPMSPERRDAILRQAGR